MSQSEVFKRMFLSDFEEASTNKVEIKDVDENTMNHLIKWTYTGQAEDNADIEKLFIVADKYDFKILKVN